MLKSYVCDHLRSRPVVRTSYLCETGMCLAYVEGGCWSVILCW